MKLRELVRLCNSMGQECINNGLCYYLDNDKIAVKAVDKDITEAKIFEGTEIIGVSAFKDCMYLEDIDIPRGITRVEDSAFYN